MPRRSPFVLGWALVTLGAVLFRALTVSQWSYFQDDWILVVDAGHSSVWHFVAQSYNGHVMPGGSLVIWVTTALAPLDYTWAAVVTCALTALVMVAWGLAFRELFGDRLRLLGPLVLIAMGPTATTVGLWWAASLLYLPVQAAMGLAIYFAARYVLRGERRRDKVGVLLSVLLGLLFWQKAVLIAIPLALLPLMVAPGSLRDRLRLGLRGLWPTAALLAAYVVFYLAVPRPALDTFATEFPRGRTPGQVLDFLGSGMVNLALPALFGGPFGEISSAYGVYERETGWIRIACLVTVVLTILVALRFRSRAGWAVLMGAAYAFAAWGLVLFSSRYDDVGTRLVFEGRYICDVLPVLLLALMFLVTPLRDQTHETLHRPLGPFAPGLLRVSLVAWVVLASCLAIGTSSRNWDATEPGSPGPWVTAVVDDMNTLGKGDVYDSIGPESAINPTFYFGRANLSDLLSPLDLDLTFNQPTQDGLLIVGPDGHVSEGEVVSPATSSVTPGPAPDCGYPLQPGNSASIPLTGSIYAFEWIVQIDYFASGDADVTVATDNQAVDLALAATEPGALSRLQYVVVDSVGRLEMTLAPDSEPVCVTAVHVGGLLPTDRRPAPLEALP